MLDYTGSIQGTKLSCEKFDKSNSPSKQLHIKKKSGIEKKNTKESKFYG